VKLWPEGGLWRRSDFLKLWSAETVSQFGTQISQLALPLAAIDVLHASAFEVAALKIDLAQSVVSLRRSWISMDC